MLHAHTPLARRTCLARIGAVAAGVLSPPDVLAATDLHSQAELQSRGLQANGIDVTMPPLADNSNAIPLQFTLQAPQGKQLVGFDIIAPENPNRIILRLKMGLAQTRFKFSTRIRLAMTQEVWVVAHLNDGSSLGRATHTVVTATACFDET